MDTTLRVLTAIRPLLRLQVPISLCNLPHSRLVSHCYFLHPCLKSYYTLLTLIPFILL